MSTEGGKCPLFSGFYLPACRTAVLSTIDTSSTFIDEAGMFPRLRNSLL